MDGFDRNMVRTQREKRGWRWGKGSWFGGDEGERVEWCQDESSRRRGGREKERE